jgi:hypothetical protein
MAVAAAQQLNPADALRAPLISGVRGLLEKLMGAWSIKPFDNDSALDFVGDIADTSTADEITNLILRSFADYAEYHGKRSRGENKVIRTAENAEWMLSQITPPIDPYVETAVRARIGKEDIDTGSSEAFVAIAASTMVAALRNGDLSSLPEELQKPHVQAYAPCLAHLQEAVATLKLIQCNTDLSHECGKVWMRCVKSLTKELQIVVSSDSPSNNSFRPTR